MKANKPLEISVIGNFTPGKDAFTSEMLRFLPNPAYANARDMEKEARQWTEADTRGFDVPLMKRAVNEIYGTKKADRDIVVVDSIAPPLFLEGYHPERKINIGGDEDGYTYDYAFDDDGDEKKMRAAARQAVYEMLSAMFSEGAVGDMMSREIEGWEDAIDPKTLTRDAMTDMVRRKNEKLKFLRKNGLIYPEDKHRLSKIIRAVRRSMNVDTLIAA